MALPYRGIRSGAGSVTKEIAVGASGEAMLASGAGESNGGAA